jgi:formamidopyrimidine-DNA glycosylase
MPEGLEVYHLACVLRARGVEPGARSIGKHLYVQGQDWTFGLSGRVNVVDGKLVKINTGRVYGTTTPEVPGASSRLGVDFASAPETVLAGVVADQWMGSRRQLGSLLLDQDVVSGIGVAWGSEVLHAAGGLHPARPAKNQDLRGLASAMCRVRDAALAAYSVVEEVDGWFDTLYAVRSMAVYKKGTPVEVGARTWWM